MCRRVIQLAVAVVLSNYLGIVGIAWAGGDSHEHHGASMAGDASDSRVKALEAAPVRAEDGTVTLNNQICPVSGEKLGGAMGEPYPYAHGGVVYNLCCKMCTGKFEKNPAKYAVSAAALKKIVA